MSYVKSHSLGSGIVHFTVSIYEGKVGGNMIFDTHAHYDDDGI